MERINFYHLLVLLLLVVCTTAFVHTDQFKTVTAIIRRNPGFSKLQSLLRLTELGFKLDQSRDLTFLAPDNVAIEELAFDQIGGNYLKYGDTLQVLSNHVIPEVVKIGELSEGVHDFETLAGSTLSFKVSRKRGEAAEVLVSVKDSNLVEKLHNDKGVEAMNGMVYSISKLLVPTNLEGIVKTAKKNMEAGKRAPSESAATATAAVNPADEVIDQADDLFGVPEHVQATNRVHWNEKDAAASADSSPAVEIAPEDKNEQKLGTESDSNALTSNREGPKDVGVLYTESVNDDKDDDDAANVIIGRVMGEKFMAP